VDANGGLFSVLDSVRTPQVADRRLAICLPSRAVAQELNCRLETTTFRFLIMRMPTSHRRWPLAELCGDWGNGASAKSPVRTKRLGQRSRFSSGVSLRGSQGFVDTCRLYAGKPSVGHFHDMATTPLCEFVNPRCYSRERLTSRYQ
jgi:hypothetical protein